MSGRLAGRVAVITGATSGIGASTAELFVEEGATVVLVGRRADRGAALARSLGDAASFFRADVAVEDDVAACIRSTVERFGRLDCLVNNAGSPAPVGDFASIDLARFDAALRVHLGGTLAGIKHAAPVMSEQGHGSIVNTASVNGSRAGLTGAAYSTAKAAVIHLTRCAAVELGQLGVRVNSVSPGPVMTGIFGKSMALGDDAADDDLERTRAVFGEIVPRWQPLPRIAEPADIAPVILFLASDDARHVNGHDLIVDGGLAAGRPASIMRSEGMEIARAMQQAA
jgi:NAD(P)-dependent dehydrogenase (short-subunit alcohol dehydrogenase family)